jgi:hypothetical protein
LLFASKRGLNSSTHSQVRDQEGCMMCFASLRTKVQGSFIEAKKIKLHISLVRAYPFLRHREGGLNNALVYIYINGKSRYFPVVFIFQ